MPRYARGMNVMRTDLDALLDRALTEYADALTRLATRLS